ncbi:MerR family transcriptional regulator [Agrobacterium sp. rho-13.3]|uniref:MerR family transcriptional regulator n=1 Tax=Agrobacterium sp. rho-13.3 TaxID=3072980 RepID=UPI002A12987D|nr:MerR family transcriptional regulator [Agrobacterium sp. rho-13.3]MDX8309051.1 MerR family transcriptional regulator [Agrobacterium sp. rho-13.3]
MNDSKQIYRVSEAARLIGVSASTLRLWESQCLVIPDRSEKGHRHYTTDQIARLKHISWLRKDRGLNPAAIRETLDLEEQLPESETSQPANETPPDIGPRFRALRHASGKTLDAVTADLGMATSKLSTFERTSHGFSIRDLKDLAEYFGTTISTISGENPTVNRALVKSGEWKSWPTMAPGVTIQLLAEGRNMMDCHRFILAPGASSEGAYDHEGEEFIFVLSGRFEITLEGQDFYELSPGDSLYFESRRQHAWRNRFDGDTVLIWINTPPTF